MSDFESLPSQNSYEELADGFKFDLGDHTVVEPDSERGRVTNIKEVTLEDIAQNRLFKDVSVYEIYVEDPYVAADPAGYELVTQHVERTEDLMRQYGYSPSQRVLEAYNQPNGVVPLFRTEAGSRDEQNVFTQAWTEDPRVDAIRIWRDLVPTAEALDYLMHPTVGREIENKVGEVAVNSPEAAIQMRFVADSVAIRDRSVAMQRIAEGFLERNGHAAKPLKWLSLATGTAEPAIAAARAVELKHGVQVDMTVTDIDSNALEHVEENAARYGMEGKVTTIRANITRPSLVDRLNKNGIEQPQFDVVENMGFEEYLPQDGDEIRAHRGARLPQASDFTRMAFDLVKPGGILISGNMVYPRPQFDYVFGIVDWPIINARSEKSILRVYDKAGILGDPKAKVDLFRVINSQNGLHVYDIVRVAKLP